MGKLQFISMIMSIICIIPSILNNIIPAEYNFSGYLFIQVSLSVPCIAARGAFLFGFI